MALQYLTHIDLKKNELRNAVIEVSANAPSSPAEGQIYYDSTAGDKSIHVYNGSAWVSVGGDITGVLGGTGLSGGGTGGTVTLNIANSGVTAATYGSSTAIPVIAVNAQGQITSASTATISTDLTIAADSGSNDDVTLGTDTLTFSGTANEIETAVSNNEITIGLVTNPTVSGNLIVSGNLTVSGTTTTVNSNTVNIGDNIIVLNSDETGTPSQNAGIEVERGNTTNAILQWNETDDDWEFQAYNHAGTPALTTYKIPTTFAAAIGDGSATSIAVAHNLGSKNVIVQLFHVDTDETVYADVVRTNANTVTVSFTAAPAASKIKVLISKVG
jgi:hypothetical protein|tara:strand:- start:284 stop:1273 length:990 start_codon:yes stop_codon:yes gene_type:complete